MSHSPQRLDDAIREGERAFSLHQAEYENPYTHDDELAVNWAQGYHNAALEYDANPY